MPLAQRFHLHAIFFFGGFRDALGFLFLRFRLRKRFRCRRQIFLRFDEFRRRFLDVRRQIRQILPIIGERLRKTRRLFANMRNFRFLYAIIPAQPLLFPLPVRNFFRQPPIRIIETRTPKLNLRARRFQDGQFRLRRRFGIRRLRELCLPPLDAFPDRGEPLQNVRRFERLLFECERVERLCFLRRFLHRCQLLGEDRHQIFHAIHIVRRPFQFGQAVLFLHPITADARHFFKNLPPLFRPRRQDAIHAILPDNGKRGAPQPRIRKKLLDVSQTARSLIDEKFAVPVSEHAPRHGHLRRIRRQLMRRIVQHHRHLGAVFRLARHRAGENNILRPLPAQIAHILLAQHPTHRVGNIALPAAVRPDNHRDAFGKYNLRPIGERFESRQHQFQ